MDIAVIIPSLDKYGGAERVAIECIQRWQSRHNITIYATAIDRALLLEHGVGEAVALQGLSPYFEGPSAMLLNAVLLPKVWRQEIGRHDVYHAHLWPTHLVDLHPMVWYPHEPLRVLHDLRLEQIVVESGNRVARNVHLYPKYNYDHITDSPYDAYLSAIDAMDKTARPDRMVANSHYIARYLESVYGNPVPDIVYPGVDADGYIELPTDPNLFVTISQLWPHKRINLLVEAISMTDEIQLIVIGSGPERERLIEQTNRLGVGDRVFFMSGLTNRELRLVLARACAFVYAPIREPFGIVVLEAMAAGKAIVAVNEGGFVEVCNSECAALLPAFPAEFAKKLSHLRTHPEVAQKMGRAGQRIAANYSWDRTAEHLERILADVCREWTEQRPPAHRQTPSTTLVGAQYYLWYGDGYAAAHWNDNTLSGSVTDQPILGYYGSSKGRTIEYHFDLFERMGLDYAALNLHVDGSGPNEVELVGIQHAFEIAADRKLGPQLAVQIAPYGVAAQDLLSVVRMVERQFAWRRSYLRLNNKPVLFWFWSGALDGDKAYVEACSEAARGFCNVAASLRMAAGVDEAKLTFGFFDGMTPFSPLEMSSPQQWELVWAEAVSAARKAGFPISVVTVSPGYNDQALDDPQRRGNPHRDVPRHDGETYERSTAFVEALDYQPDLVMISTFNEFHENTHIEPTTSHGDLYVELTREFVERLRNQGGRQ